MTITERLKKAVAQESSPNEMAAEASKFVGPLRCKGVKIVSIKSFGTGYGLGAKAENARLRPILTALIECVEALDELNDILDDPEAREEIDSFTGQTARAAIGLLEKELGGGE